MWSKACEAWPEATSFGREITESVKYLLFSYNLVVPCYIHAMRWATGLHAPQKLIVRGGQRERLPFFFVALVRVVRRDFLNVRPAAHKKGRFPVQVGHDTWGQAWRIVSSRAA